VRHATVCHYANEHVTKRGPYTAGTNLAEDDTVQSGWTAYLPSFQPGWKGTHTMFRSDSHTSSRLTRRQLTAGAAIGAFGLSVFPRISFAQETPAGTPAAAPAGAVIWLKYNLNAANDDQLLSIPGMGDKMLGEFHEYAPYTSIAQFRQEIGKYVDEDVVAGYERYVYVPVDPASSDADTFAQLPGVSADIADQLTSGAPYADDAAFLAALSSVVSAEFAALAPRFLASTAAATATWIKFNLNTASDDQFLTIPGIGEKMLDEFNEYKPYSSIVQFRQEIGKYVDESQVSDWEHYVFVPVNIASADAETLMQLPGASDEDANSLVDSVPFADAAAFEAVLGSLVSAEQLALAAGFLSE
jgi:DNA uptake protein ComE-like DNA-binding protein